MIIGVDAGALSITDDRLKVGVYRVTKNALTTLASIDNINNYRLYSFEAIEEGILNAFEGRAEVVQLPKLGWQRVWLPLQLNIHPVDAFLGFSQSLPSVHTLCDIGFIYDLGFLHEPEAYRRSAGTLKNQTSDLVRRANHIITISEATKMDIIRSYGIPGEKIIVGYPGVNSRFSPAGATYTGTRPYFLFVGSLTKTKDIPTLLEAFAQFCKKNRFYDLMLIGGDYWPDREIGRAIGKLGLENRVKRMGFMGDAQLPNYYRGATAFVTAALWEGFCLPAVEAMACGTPVVALDRGALKEVVGEGGIILRQTSGFAEAMGVMTDTKKRMDFSKRAVLQAKHYRWDLFAQRLLRALPS